LPDGGAVRAGLAPYTDDTDVDRLLTAVAEVAGVGGVGGVGGAGRAKALTDDA
jgi:hypothetical protein